MVAGKNGQERRRHDRITLKDRIFITFRPHFDRIGSVTDISTGGVSLEYSVVQEYSALTDKFSVDIFSSPKKLEMSNLPCRLVYDERINAEKGFFETLETRRCGLAFDGLTQYQAAQLEAELKKFDAEILEPRVTVFE
jgi:hypothetical protein